MQHDSCWKEQLHVYFLTLKWQFHGSLIQSVTAHRKLNTGRCVFSGRSECLKWFSPLQGIHCVLPLGLDCIRRLHRFNIFPIIIFIHQSARSARKLRYICPSSKQKCPDFLPATFTLQANRQNIFMSSVALWSDIFAHLIPDISFLLRAHFCTYKQFITFEQFSYFLKWCSCYFKGFSL